MSGTVSVNTPQQDVITKYTNFFVEKMREAFALQKLLTFFRQIMAYLGGAMVLGKLPVPGCPTIWMVVRQGPIALAVGAGGGCLDIFFSPLSFLSSFSLFLGDGLI